MKSTFLILALCFLASAVSADLVSGPRPGDPAGPFTVVKCGGAADGVEVGAELCYRTRYGNATQIIVFARDAGAVLPLARELDKLAGEQPTLRAFVNVLGPDLVAAEEAAAGLGQDAGLRHLVVAVPLENANGPVSYHLAPDAQITALVIREGRVAANHASSAVSSGLVSAILASARENVR